MADEINEIVDALRYLYTYGTGQEAQPIGFSYQFVSLQGINTGQDELNYIAQAVAYTEIEEDPRLIPVIYVMKKEGTATNISRFQKTSYLLTRRDDVQPEHIIKLSSTSIRDFTNLGTKSGSLVDVINNSLATYYRQGEIIQIANPTNKYFLHTGPSTVYGVGMNQVEQAQLKELNQEPTMQSFEISLDEIQDELVDIQQVLQSFSIDIKPLQKFRNKLNF